MKRCIFRIGTGRWTLWIYNYNERWKEENRVAKDWNFSIFGLTYWKDKSYC